MIRSKKHLTRILQITLPELREIFNNIDAYYYRKEEVKLDKNGLPKCDRFGQKVRILYPSIGLLKNIQITIKNAILSKIPLEDCVYGGVKKRDNVLNARAHKGKKYKFLTDLKEFFPSIKPKSIYESLVQAGFSYDVAHLITKLTTYKNQVPQGCPTSTHIANIALKQLDSDLTTIAKLYGITYTRYVDDMTFSSQQCFKHVLPEIINRIQVEYSLSNRKTGYAAGAIMITGARTGNNKLDISDELKDKLNHPERYNNRQIRGQQSYSKRVGSM